MLTFLNKTWLENWFRQIYSFAYSNRSSITVYCIFGSLYIIYLKMACFACAQCFLWQRKGINTNIQFHCCKSQRARLNELQHFAADRKTRLVWHAPLPSSPKWLSDNVLLQFKPCHVFLPSSIENHLFFFFLASPESGLKGISNKTALMSKLKPVPNV